MSHSTNDNTSYKYRGDDSLRRPPSHDFHCGENALEEDDDDEEEYDCITTINFYCTVSTPAVNGKRLEFSCREPSCGVLINDEEKAEKKNEGEDEGCAMDPNFFDEGYTLAGKTGWQVWPGSRLLVESLTFPQPSFDGESLREIQGLLSDAGDGTGGARVLELGAGVGMVGSSLANYGAQVLMTDLPTLVDHSLIRNLEKNYGVNVDGGGGGIGVLEEKKIESEGGHEHEGRHDKCPTWLHNCHAVPIGRGWAGAIALDWTCPLNEQLTEVQQDVDLVVASDCVWLISMLDGLLGTVEQLFQYANKNRTTRTRAPKLLMSFQRRDPKDGGESDMFTSVDHVLTEIQRRNWCFECLSWCPVAYKGEEDKEVFVFLISPSS